MAGTKVGAAKMRATMIKDLGGEEAYRQYIIERGRRGGLKQVPKGTARMSKEKHLEISRKGGLVKASNRRSE